MTGLHSCYVITPGSVRIYSGVDWGLTDIGLTTVNTSRSSCDAMRGSGQWSAGVPRHNSWDEYYLAVLSEVTRGPPHLLIVEAGAREVEAEAPAQPPRWGRVVFRPALQWYLVLALLSNCGSTR